MNIDLIIRIGASLALLMIAMLVLYFVWTSLTQKLWYRCPECGRWQREDGTYGIPPTEESIGGENLCSHCEKTVHAKLREQVRHRSNALHRGVSDDELRRRIRA